MSREYTIADWAERMEYHKRRQQNRSESSSNVKVVFRAHFKEEDPQKKAYYGSGYDARKRIREESLNHKLNRWF